MTPEGTSKRKWLIITLLVLAFIIVPVIYYLASTVSRSGKVEVSLITLPDDATVTMNGTVVKQGTLLLTPGDYTVKAERNGFAASEKKETIVKDAKKTITISLTPITDEAKNWLENNRKKVMEFEGKAGRAASEEGVEFRKKNPIVNVLPAGSYLYQLGYRSDPSDPTGNSIIVTIDASAGYRNAALAKIRELGFDPAELKIQFKNYESPFKDE